MASIDTPISKSAPKGRLKKKSTSVDLTPMVDLGFLLITFFVFTSTMARPTAMKIDLPIDKNPPEDKVCNSCVLTTVLCNKDSILYYQGDLEKAATAWCDYEHIRQIIQEKQKAVQQARGAKEQFVLIIKPAENCLFKNFVDLTDEVTINGVKRYYIDDLTADEKSFLKL